VKPFAAVHQSVRNPVCPLVQPSLAVAPLADELLKTSNVLP
jgi:hypothetical protein